MIKTRNLDSLRKKLYSISTKLSALILLLLFAFVIFYLFRFADGATPDTLTDPTCVSQSNKCLLAAHYLETSHKSGTYEAPFVLGIKKLGATTPGGIRYTTDGSDPIPGSRIYSSGIPVDSSAVVKFALFDGETRTSNVETQSFILHKHTFPVVSLVTEPSNLWDPEYGIYVGGVNSNKSNLESYNFNKRGPEWRKPARFTYFDENGNLALDMDVEIRISGGATRFHPQKTLRVCAQEKYGHTSIDFNFFKDSDNMRHKCILLRNGGNDWDRVMFRDILGQSLIFDTDVDTQAYQPAVLYLNGEYWGIHNIREFYDDQYLKYRYGATKDSVVIIEPDRKDHGNPTVRDGKPGDEKVFVQLMENLDDFDYLKKNIDLENYIDYFLINVYTANDDWPENNIRIWRFKTDAYEHTLFQPLDGKWRWLLFDLDSSLGLFKTSSYDYNTLEFATRSKIKNETWPTELIRTLLENEEFRIMFINRYADLLNTNFSPERVLATVEHLEATYAPEIPKHTERWGGRTDKGGKPAFGDIYKWRENVAVLKEFATKRGDYARMHVVDKFGLSGTSIVSVNIENSSQGYVRINTIDTRQTQDKVKFEYFNDVPVEIEAVPSSGYKFAGWGNDLLSESRKQTLILRGNIELNPVFTLNWWGRILNSL